MGTDRIVQCCWWASVILTGRRWLVLSQLVGSLTIFLQLLEELGWMGKIIHMDVCNKVYVAFQESQQAERVRPCDCIKSFFGSTIRNDNVIDCWRKCIGCKPIDENDILHQFVTINVSEYVAGHYANAATVHIASESSITKLAVDARYELSDPQSLASRRVIGAER